LDCKRSPEVVHPLLHEITSILHEEGNGRGQLLRDTEIEVRPGKEHKRLHGLGKPDGGKKTNDEKINLVGKGRLSHHTKTTEFPRERETGQYMG